MSSFKALDTLHAIASGALTVDITAHNEADELALKKSMPAIAAEHIEEPMSVTAAWHITDNEFDQPKLHLREAYLALKGSEIGKQGLWIVCVGDPDHLQQNAVAHLADMVSLAVKGGVIKNHSDAGLIVNLTKATCRFHMLAYVAREMLETPVRRRKNVIALAPTSSFVAAFT
jgi:hypothetical protein